MLWRSCAGRGRRNRSLLGQRERGIQEGGERDSFRGWSHLGSREKRFFFICIVLDCANGYDDSCDNGIGGDGIRGDVRRGGWDGGGGLGRGGNFGRDAQCRGGFGWIGLLDGRDYRVIFGESGHFRCIGPAAGNGFGGALMPDRLRRGRGCGGRGLDRRGRRGGRGRWPTR